MVAHGSNAATASRRLDRSWLTDGAIGAACLLGIILGLVWVFRPPSAAGGAVKRRDLARAGMLHKAQGVLRRRLGDSLVWRRLALETPIYGDDTLYAGAHSAGRIELVAGGALALEPNSLVSIAPPKGRQAPSQAIGVSVRVLRGSVAGTAGTAPMQLTTGAGHIELSKGGQARISVDARQRGHLEVHRGRAQLAGGKSPQRTLGPAQRQRLAAGGRPRGQPQQLADILIEPKAGARLRPRQKRAPITLRWQAAAGQRYTVAVAASARFTKILRELEGVRPPVQVSGLPRGVYYWRVQWHEGKQQQQSPTWRFDVHYPQPPQPYRPARGSVLPAESAQALYLAWTRHAHAAAYELVLSRARADGQPKRGSVVARTVPRAQWRVQRPLPNGHYCFKVRALGPDAPASPWSQHRCFRIAEGPLLEAPKPLAPVREPLPAAPADAPKTPAGSESSPPDSVTPSPAAGDEHGSLWWRLLGSVAHAAANAPPERSALVLRWASIAGARAYQLQISRDRAFSERVVDARVAGTAFRWPKVPHRDYYWRVAGIDARNRRGAFSRPVRIPPEASPPELLAPASDERFHMPSDADGITLRWSQGGNLHRYEVLVGRTAELERPVVQRRVRHQKVTLKLPGPGVYYWRVDGIDAFGERTGPAGTRRFIVQPAAPSLQNPQDASRLTAGASNVALVWAAPEPCSRFRLHVGRDDALRTVVANAVTSQPQRSIQLPAPGGYAWRVRCLRPRSPWSPPRTFSIPPKRPAVRVLSSDREGIALGWPAVKHAAYYTLAVRPTAGDAAPRLRARTSQHRFAFVNLPPGQYVIGVRAHTVDGTGSRPARLVASAVGGDAQRSGLLGWAAAAELAPIVGVSTTPGGIGGPRAGVQVAVQPQGGPAGFWVALRGSYQSSVFGLRAPRPLQSWVWAHLLPMGLLAEYRWPLGPVGLTAAVGPLLRWTHVHLRDLSGTTRRETLVDVAGVLRAGAQTAVGPGHLFGEVAYAGGSAARGQLLQTAAHQLALAMGYRIALW